MPPASTSHAMRTSRHSPHHRKNLFALAPDLHPVVAAVAARMIEPDRAAGPGPALAGRAPRDLPRPAARLRPRPGRRRALGSVMSAAPCSRPLRDRLFDLSRRNRLIWFRPSAQSLNLTEASVPLLLDPRNIRPEQLFTWPATVAAPGPVRLAGVARLCRSAGRTRRTRTGSSTPSSRRPGATARSTARLSCGSSSRSCAGTTSRANGSERISSPLLLLPVDADPEARRARQLPAPGRVARGRGQPRAAPAPQAALRPRAARDGRPPPRSASRTSTRGCRRDIRRDRARRRAAPPGPAPHRADPLHAP